MASFEEQLEKYLAKVHSLRAREQTTANDFVKDGQEIINMTRTLSTGDIKHETQKWLEKIHQSLPLQDSGQPYLDKDQPDHSINLLYDHLQWYQGFLNHIMDRLASIMWFGEEDCPPPWSPIQKLLELLASAQEAADEGQDPTWTKVLLGKISWVRVATVVDLFILETGRIRQLASKLPNLSKHESSRLFEATKLEIFGPSDVKPSISEQIYEILEEEHLRA